jgi:paraquat-inducible protein A
LLTVTAAADLIACPTCDALYRVRPVGKGERATCARCHAVLIAPRAKAGMTVIMLATANMVLIAGAVAFPFLSISTTGLTSSASLIEVALGFSGGPLVALSLATLGLIVLVPLLRAMLLVYVVTPVVFDRAPRPHAATAFRWSERLRPWSMAEIFLVGCAVALVKVADLATVQFGPAFWMLVVLVLLAILQDRTLCRWSVWSSITPRGAA